MLAKKSKKGVKMPKNVKKSYHFMSLRYDATAEDVKIRQKIMIKIARAKAFRTGKSSASKVAKISEHANIILESIDKIGPQKCNIHFDTTLDDLGSFLAFTMVMVGFAVVTFCIFL